MKKQFISVAMLTAMLSFTASVVKAEREAPLSVTAEDNGGKATIRITGYIHEWSSANAVDLGVKIDALTEAGYTEATVYINTKGGQTWEANEIVNTLRRFKGKLNGEAGAMVFSAGTYIACKLDTFKVHSNSQFMWHKPQATLEGTHDEIESDLKMLANVEADYLKAYAEKTGRAETELKALWDKGDQWLMGQEVVDAGFADGLIESDAPVSEADVAALTAVCAPVVPVATATPKPRQKQNDTDMKTIDPTAIGLSADATQAQIDAKLKELKAAADEAAVLKQEKTDAETATKAADIKATLDRAVKDRKITADLRPHYEKVLDNDLETGKKIVEGLAAVEAIGGQLVPVRDADPEARKDWDLGKWQKEDPEGLQAKAEKDGKWFDTLVAADTKRK